MTHFCSHEQSSAEQAALALAVGTGTHKIRYYQLRTTPRSGSVTPPYPPRARLRSKSRTPRSGISLAVVRSIRHALVTAKGRPPTESVVLPDQRERLQADRLLSLSPEGLSSTSWSSGACIRDTEGIPRRGPKGVEIGRRLPGSEGWLG